MFLGFQITVPTVTDYSTVGTGYRHDHAAHQKSDVRKSEQAPIPQPAQRVQNEQQQKRWWVYIVRVYYALHVRAPGGGYLPPMVNVGHDYYAENSAVIQQKVESRQQTSKPPQRYQSQGMLDDYRKLST